MGRYKILASIIVEGEDITSERRALNELDYMLGAYDDEIEENTISISVKFVNEVSQQ